MGLFWGGVEEKEELCEENPSCAGKFGDVNTWSAVLKRWDRAKDCVPSGWTTFHEGPDYSCVLSLFYFE